MIENRIWGIEEEKVKESIVKVKDGHVNASKSFIAASDENTAQQLIRALEELEYLKFLLKWREIGKEEPFQSRCELLLIDSGSESDHMHTSYITAYYSFKDRCWFIPNYWNAEETVRDNRKYTHWRPSISYEGSAILNEQDENNIIHSIVRTNLDSSAHFQNSKYGKCVPK